MNLGMAGKNRSQRMAREKNFILIVSALILLTLAGLFAVDSKNRARLSASALPKTPRTSLQEASPRTAPLIREAFDYFAKQNGIQAQTLDSLSASPQLFLTTHLSEAHFSRILQGFLRDSACRLQSWTGEAPHYAITLRRRQDAMTLDLRFGGVRHRASLSTTGDESVSARRMPREASGILPDHAGAQSPPAKIALILDDAGSGSQSQWAFLDLPVKLSFAVLPGHPNSRLFAEKALDRGHEVIVHLPMQPLHSERQALEKEMLIPGMGEREVARILDAALLTIPGAIGINNHQGSFATQDRDLMRNLMRCLALRGLFFVDSFTHAASVGLDEATRAGMPGRRRDIFLDDRIEPAYIEEALHALTLKAARDGKAIGIGHVTKPETLQVLQDKLPRYRAAGIEFVGISEIP